MPYTGVIYSSVNFKACPVEWVDCLGGYGSPLLQQNPLTTSISVSEGTAYV